MRWAWLLGVLLLGCEIVSEDADAGATVIECPGTSPAGCSDGDCPANQQCVVDPTACHPSSCACDGQTGEWVCTADCGGGTCLAEGECAGHNPAGCLQNGCPEGQRCEADPGQCTASSCGCVDGEWACTADCNGGTCVPAGGCQGPNPAGCREGGCPDGQRCEVDPGACLASSCECRDDVWSCTEDCGGGRCVPAGGCPGESPAGCAEGDCPDGQRCEVVPGLCPPLSCECVDGAWSCADEPCGGQCVPVSACDGESPAGCGEGDCPAGQRCEIDPDACLASSCACEDGAWVCTEDCGGGRCVPAGPCDRPNPRGCQATGCPDGQQCVVDPDECRPSECVCGPNGWACTPDCSGGSCVPAGACEGPNPAGCRERDCPDDQACMFDPNQCVPSSCECTPDGWACTNDCDGGSCGPAGVCDGPNPQGCRDVGCPNGQACMFDPNGCVPSSCQCTPDGWVCTDDCGGGFCAPAGVCEGPNPAGCRNQGCPAGQQCSFEEGVCTSSSCQCTPDGWVCTRDCGGGVCVPAGACDGPNPQGCRDVGCPDGERCSLAHGICIPSRCECGPDGWACVDDCNGGMCVPGDGPCAGPNPRGCRQDGCGPDERCSFDEALCVPSNCECTPDGWACTNDCGGGLCVPDAPGCDGPNPAGCRQNGCPEGMVCGDAPDACVPSACQCDPQVGAWMCTADCGGGICQPPDPGRLRWYLTCGDPVCRGHQEHPDVPRCDQQVRGDPCNAPDAMCDPGDECNALLVCTDSDPRAGPCPISERKHKRNIEYLDEASRGHFHDALMAIRLATYRYKDQPMSTGPRLGFIIDDGVPAEVVNGARERVDLYGYTSLAVAALQAQSQEISALRAEIADLRAEMKALREATSGGN